MPTHGRSRHASYAPGQAGRRKSACPACAPPSRPPAWPAPRPVPVAQPAGQNPARRDHSVRTPTPSSATVQFVKAQNHPQAEPCAVMSRPVVGIEIAIPQFCFGVRTPLLSAPFTETSNGYDPFRGRHSGSPDVRPPDTSDGASTRRLLRWKGHPAGAQHAHYRGGEAVPRCHAGSGGDWHGSQARVLLSQECWHRNADPSRYDYVVRSSNRPAVGFPRRSSDHRNADCRGFCRSDGIPRTA